MMRGAEAIITPVTFLGKKLLKKTRGKKEYRISEIDLKLRIERTRREARLLHKAKLAGVLCPTVYEVGRDYIVMDKLYGKKLSESADELEIAGEILGKLHAGGIIHGDFNPHNIIVNPEGMYIIDFGLGFFSKKTEARSDDVISMLRGIGGKKYFLNGYKKFKESSEVLTRIKHIENRARYR